MARALITGCSGFVGRVLARHLSAAGHEVWGVDRDRPDGAPVPAGRFVVADLTDADATARALETTEPEWVVHLAAQSSVRESFDRPTATIVNNTLPALNLLDRLRAGGRVRLLAVGSAEEYGAVRPEAMPLAETTPVDPQNPYALAKSIQGQCCRVYASLYGVDVVATRSFNHAGAGQRDTFVLSSFARQVTEIALGKREPALTVGNLDIRRDFTDVRDVCGAYLALLERGVAGETYNVCSGVSRSIRDLLDMLCEIAGVEAQISVDPERLRPVDTPELCGDGAKIKAATGWGPSVPIEETLRALLAYWRDQLTAGSSANSSR